MTPATAPLTFVAKEIIGVVHSLAQNQTLIPCATKALTARRANFSEFFRASLPITTPYRHRSGNFFLRYVANPCEVWITVRQFMLANPAAIFPRRPAVPNRIPGVDELVQLEGGFGLQASQDNGEYTYGFEDAFRAPRHREHHAASLSRSWFPDPFHSKHELIELLLQFINPR